VTQTATATPLPTQAQYAGSCHEEALPGMATWTNPQNAAGPPNVQTADVSMTTNQQSNRLVCDAFGFTIPANARIIGIQVQMVRGMVGGQAFQAIDLSAKLRKANNTLSADRGTGIPIPAGASIADFPAPPTNTDQWDLQNLTPADINSPTFAFLYQSAKTRAGATSTERVDSVQMIITYTL